MSTPTSDRIGLAAVLVAGLAVAGCGGGVGLGGGPPPPTRVAVTADQIVVAGPEGFCIDPTSTRNTDDTGFVLLGNCAAIANSRRIEQPATPAVLTAAISAPSQDGGRLADSIGELDAFFRSDEGLSLLSRTGDAQSVTILETALEGEVFLLHAADRSEGAIEGVQEDYWRAYLDVGQRIATLSVLALEDRALSREESLETLRGFVAAVLAANGDAQTLPPGVAPVPVPPQNLPLQSGPLFNVGLFRRIFG